MKRIFFLTLPALLGGCQMIPPEGKAVGEPQVGLMKAGSPAWRGQKFARNRCSDCHAVDPGRHSTLPAAPTFDAIANRPGLTKATLTQWMGSHRNYPREMYFEIPTEHIDDLVAFMITLRRSEREPVP